MPRGGVISFFRSAAVSAGLLHGAPGFAADLPGIRLDVVRAPGATACPDAQALADTLRERLGSTRIVEGAPVVIEVDIRSDAQDLPRRSGRRAASAGFER